jgi:hypothetical protein
MFAAIKESATARIVPACMLPKVSSHIGKLQATGIALAIAEKQVWHGANTYGVISTLNGFGKGAIQIVKRLSRRRHGIPGKIP